jgi:hypothetical protein
VLGDRAGTAVVAVDDGDVPPPLAQPIVPATSREAPLPLARALAQARRERDSPREATESFEAVLGDASEASGKVERIIGLFTEIAEGRRDPASISDEVDALCGLVQRLDRDGRWEESLRVARALAMLLALLGRWIQLLHSLQVAVGAAKRLMDDSGKAWALHEQGTWQLVANEHAEADELLGKARDLRERIGDRRGQAMTERNLQALCRVLRAELHTWPDPPPKSLLERMLESPLLVVVLAVLLLVVGGAAGAIIASDADSTSNNSSAASRPPSKTTAAQAAGSGTTDAVAGQSTGSTTSSAPTGTTSNNSVGSTAEESHTVASTKGPGVPTAPFAPARITANVREAGVTVAWTAPADGGDAITAYTITPYTGAEAQPPTHVEGSSPATTAAVSGLTAGTSYTFTVSAENAIGEGPASEHSNAVTP